MKKEFIKKNILTLLFLVCLLVLSIFSWFKAFEPTIETFVGKMAESATIKSTITACGVTFTENAFLKENFVTLNSALNYFLTKDVNSSRVLVGKDKWMFYKTKIDGNPIEDFKGGNNNLVEEKEQTYENLLFLDEYFKANNTDVAYFIAPNKESIYTEYIPQNIQRKTEISRTEDLVNYINQKGKMKVVFDETPFLKYKNDYELFFKYDTHWNQLGGFLGVQQVLPMFDKNFEEIDLENQNIDYTQKYVPHLNAHDDLAEISYMTWFFDDEKDPVFKDVIELDWVKYEAEQNVRQATLFENNNAKNDEKLLLVGDSYKTAMIPALTMYYSEVYVVHEDFFSDEIFKEIAPNKVIVEKVERNSQKIGDFLCRALKNG